MHQRTIIIHDELLTGHYVDIQIVIRNTIQAIVADGDDNYGEVVFQVSRATPILASNACKRDRESERIILQFLCKTETTTMGAASKLETSNFQENVGNMLMPKLCLCLALTCSSLLPHEFKINSSGDYKDPVLMHEILEVLLHGPLPPLIYFFFS